MKLTKISLAALVALGAFSSVASATPLEEAIKNVDMSGMARYRYTNTSVKDSTPTTTERAHRAGHQFRFVTDFKAAIDDNFFGVLGLRYNQTDGSGDSGNAGEMRNASGALITTANTGTDITNTSGTFGVYQFYLGYTAGNTTVTAGKQVLGTFFTDDAVATGVKVVNTDVQGLTLAAFAMDAIESQSGWSDGDLLSTVRDTPYDTGNLYGVAAIGSYDPVGFQLWYTSLTNVADLLAVELTGDIKVSDDVAFNLKGQFVNNDADKGAKSAGIGYNDGRFYAVEAGTELFGANLNVGYIGYKAKEVNGATGRTSFSFEDQGSLIDPGEQYADFVDYTLADGKGKFWFVTAGYTFDKYFVGADYISGSKKDAAGDKEKFKEAVARATYAYSKKLKFTTWYSYAQAKEDDEKTKSNRYRFEARYSF